MEIPAPKFAVGDRIVPGPDSETSKDVGVGVVQARVFQPDLGGEVTEATWLYGVQFPGTNAQMLEARMEWASETGGSDDYQVPSTEPVPDGWQGTPPAEGTRRRLILTTIYGAMGDFIPEGGQGLAEVRAHCAQQLADAVESALLNATIDQEDEEEKDISAGIHTRIPQRVIFTDDNPLKYPVPVVAAKTELALVRGSDGRHLVLEEDGEIVPGIREATPEEIDSCVALTPGEAQKLVTDQQFAGGLAGRQGRGDPPAGTGGCCHRGRRRDGHL